VLSEVAQTVDDVVVISRGRLSYKGSIGDFTRRAGGDLTRVRAASVERLRPALEAAGATLREGGDHGALLVADLDAPAIGEIALREGVALQELTAHGASLEDVFLELTADPVEVAQP
jgi:ABC-2 type transport system ATP-binding protein